MKYGFCFLAVIPLRKEASDASEMVSQMLFGDVFEITEIGEKWLRIKMIFDGYEGWIDKKQCLEISKDECENILSSWKSTTAFQMGNVLFNGCRYPIVFGAVLPQSNSFSAGGKDFAILSETKTNQDFLLLEIIDFYKGTPYLWGGRSPFGIDCSGFAQNVFKIRGFYLFRDVSQQVLQGIEILSIQEMKPYDLLFFSNKEGRIIHVGIALAEQKIIHASGHVRIDQIDDYGIFNKQKRLYTHQLCSIRRIIE